MPARNGGLPASPEPRAGPRMGSGLQKRRLDVALNGPQGKTFSPSTMNRTGGTPPLPGRVPCQNAWFQFGPASIPNCQKTVMRLRTCADPFPKNIFPPTHVNARTTLVQRSYERLPVPLPGRAVSRRRARPAFSCNRAAAVSSRPLWDPASAPHAAGGPFPKNIFPQTLVNARPTLVQRSYERLPVPLPGRAASSPRARPALSSNTTATVSSRPLWDPAFAPHAAGGTLPSRRHTLQIPAGPDSSLPRRAVSDAATYARWASYCFAKVGQC